MSLIKCKECNNNVSDKAYNCPNCGYVINKLPKNQGCFMKSLNFGCLIFFIITIMFLLSFIVRYFINKSA